MFGAALTTVSAVLFLVFFLLDVAGFHTNPYFGIVTFLLLPAGFVLGLLLMPVGYWRARRRLALGKHVAEWPRIDLGQPRVRRILIVVMALTGLNIAIVAMAATKSVEYVDSEQFCTSVCHEPMEPESVAHRRSVHASISCTSCHVAPGAQGFVEAKLGGVRRLKGVLVGDYGRPIPVPVHDLPAPAGTCLNCHSQSRYTGEKIRQIRYYSDDEAVTEQITTLTMKVGGGGSELGGPSGIHWHASADTRIEYVAMDGDRGTIPWVRVTDARGTREYTIEGVTPEQLAGATRRVMDCTDCHNRYGHPIAATVDKAVDDALARGVLPRLPYIRREALAVLSDTERDHARAEREIADKLTGFYAQQPGLAADPRVAQAVESTKRIYTGNVFPAMKVKWGTYPSQLGHTDAPGCFRCHDDQHKSSTGKLISQDCETCHRME